MNSPWPGLTLEAQAGSVEPADQDREIDRVVALVTDLEATVRREITRRHQAGEDTAWLEQVLTELEPVAEQVHELEIVRAIRDVVARHGGGPYPAEDLAAITGISDVTAVQRALEQMVADDLADRSDESPEKPTTPNG